MSLPITAVAADDDFTYLYIDRATRDVVAHALARGEIGRLLEESREIVEICEEAKAEAALSGQELRPALLHAFAVVAHRFGLPLDDAALAVAVSAHLLLLLAAGGLSV